MTKLLTFHNDPAIKAKYVKRVEEHAKKEKAFERQGEKLLELLAKDH
jgi:hypothetical protein